MFLSFTNRTLQLRTLFLVIGFILSFFCFSQKSFAQTGAIGSIDEATAGGGMAAPPKDTTPLKGKTSSKNTSKKSKSTTSKATVQPKNTSTKSKTTAKTKSADSDDGFVIGDKYTFLNGEVAIKVHPVYRKSAREAGAVGLVQVEVLIDPDGNVISAKARTGNPLLHPEAEKAALATKFNKPSIYGKPAKAFGFMVFRFGTEEDEYRMKTMKKNN